MQSLLTVLSAGYTYLTETNCIKCKDVHQLNLNAWCSLVWINLNHYIHKQINVCTLLSSIYLIAFKVLLSQLANTMITVETLTYFTEEGHIFTTVCGDPNRVPVFQDIYTVLPIW